MKALDHGVPPELVDRLRRLAWNVEFSESTILKHPEWTLRRVLDYGQWEDYEAISRYFGPDRMRTLLPLLRCETPRARSFCKVLCSKDGSAESPPSSHHDMTAQNRQLGRIRFVLLLFVAGLVASGLTAFPLETELRLLASVLPDAASASPSVLTAWVLNVRDALVETNARHPFLPYGTDWLAFAHLVIAIAFIGPIRDPARNVWVVDFGLIACAAVVPFALIAGHIRGIPMWWRLIDCSFGVFGGLLLGIARAMIRRLPSYPSANGAGRGDP